MRTKKQFDVYVIDYGTQKYMKRFNNRKSATEYLKELKSSYEIKNEKPWKFGNALYWRIDESMYKSIVFAEHTLLDYQYSITTK